MQPPTGANQREPPSVPMGTFCTAPYTSRPTAVLDGVGLADTLLERVTLPDTDAVTVALAVTDGDSERLAPKVTLGDIVGDALGDVEQQQKMELRTMEPEAPATPPAPPPTVENDAGE